MIAINVCVPGRSRRERTVILACDPENSSLHSHLSWSALSMTTSETSHAVCLFLCDIRIMDTRRIVFNDWNLLLEERHSTAIPNSHGCKLSVSVHHCGGTEHQDLNESFGTYCSETCDGAPQRLKIIHNYFTKQRRKVFWRAPFH